MMFVIKKVLGAFLVPPGIFVSLLVLSGILAIRRQTARITSKAGTPTASSGTSRATMRDCLTLAFNATAASMNPINMLPQSPRKMEAGWKLYRRKPRQAPASAMRTRASVG